ncbi:hypothetical protein Sjap_001812 [Stephania japonica]|uniref:Uncharacterized protein n=1 Tax=Stephania japonica TaxID=461633 RepID=A0AAP0KKM5_9MAGN
MASIISTKTLKSTFVINLIILLSILGSHVNGHGGGHGDDDDEGGSSESSSDGAVDLRSRGLILVKIWCLIIFFVTTFLGGVSPYFYRWNESFLLLGTQFAGGVFLGTSLIHFLSDSNETFKDVTTKSYPFAFMLASAGYVLTMLADCIVSLVAGKAGGETKVLQGGDEDGRGAEEHGNVNHHNASLALLKTTSFGDTLLLILALCFHSVFEGIAVGVADTKKDAWRNLWTISLHKIFAAIAMGIALLRMIPKRPLVMTVAYSFAFGISSPIGVGIGIAIDATTQGHTADWIYAISMGLACGIFIYVAINHLISKGYKPHNPCYFDTPFFKFFAVLVGVGVISVVMIWD